MSLDRDPAQVSVSATDFLLAANELGIGFAWQIVDLAPDGMLVTDPEGRIVMANRQAEALFGHDRGALVGTPVDSLLPPQLRRVHERHRRSYRAAPSVRPMGSRLELSGYRADGSEFPIDVSLSPAFTEDGLAVTVVSIRRRR